MPLAGGPVSKLPAGSRVQPQITIATAQRYVDLWLRSWSTLPRWTERVHDGYREGALPRRVLLRPFFLPRSRGSTFPLSRPAQASRVLRPAGLLAHHTWTSLRDSDPPGFPNQPLASYRTQPSIVRVGPSPTGIQPTWGTHKIADATTSDVKLRAERKPQPQAWRPIVFFALAPEVFTSVGGRRCRGLPGSWETSSKYDRARSGFLRRPQPTAAPRHRNKS